MINNRMIIENTCIENFLKKHLQKKLIFSINNKNIKRGKFILFKQNNFFIDFHLYVETPSKQDIILFSLPSPFSIRETHDDQFTFNYTLSSISKNNPSLLEKLKSIKPLAKNKFYNNIVNVRTVQ